MMIRRVLALVVVSGLLAGCQGQRTEQVEEGVLAMLEEETRPYAVSGVELVCQVDSVSAIHVDGNQYSGLADYSYVVLDDGESIMQGSFRCGLEIVSDGRMVQVNLTPGGNCLILTDSDFAAGCWGHGE